MGYTWIYRPQNIYPAFICLWWLCLNIYLRIYDLFVVYQHVYVYVAHTNPCSCLCRVEAGPVEVLALCGGDLVWVSGSWQRTRGWPGQRTCHPSLRCARSCCSTTPMTPTTRCWRWAICGERQTVWQFYELLVLVLLLLLYIRTHPEL